MKRLLWIAIALLVLAFAIEGGEYSSGDLIRQHRTQVRLTRAIDSLSRVVDSLKKYENRLEHDPAFQERIAREEFGMVRGDKELLYRFTDSASAPPKP